MNREKSLGIIKQTLFVRDSCNSWYLGYNIEVCFDVYLLFKGKQREFYIFAGGVNVYSNILNQLAEGGWEGYSFT